MSGLEKMKAQILEEAENSAREIRTKAQEEAQKILDGAREAADKEASRIAREAEKEAQEYAARAVSARDMQRKQAYLAAKQEVIQEILRKAYEKVLDLDDKEYFGFMEKLLERYALPESGEIRFTEKDLKRMPEGFSGRVKTIAAAKGGSLEISNEPCAAEGGFLLVYGGVEENCTIKAVFDSKREELSDQVNRMLFAPGREG